MKRRIHDQELDSHFITFSCYRRRKLLDHELPKRIVLGVLASELQKQNTMCVGFVLMPDHVHTILWFPRPNQLSDFMKQWKQRSSVQIKKAIQQHLRRYSQQLSQKDAVWQARYYSFNIQSHQQLERKLNYMHLNPVRAGLATRAVVWKWSSARYYDSGQTVGIPIQWPP